MSESEYPMPAAIGTKDDDTVVAEPDAAEATVVGLLRGILAELQAQTALLTSIDGG